MLPTLFSVSSGVHNSSLCLNVADVQPKKQTFLLRAHRLVPHTLVCLQVEQVRLVDRFSNKSTNGTLYLTATHLIFVESGSNNTASAGQEIWVSRLSGEASACLLYVHKFGSDWLGFNRGNCVKHGKWSNSIQNALKCCRYSNYSSILKESLWMVMQWVWMISGDWRLLLS